MTAMPRIDIGSLPWKGGSGYPAPFDAIVEGRTRKRLGDALSPDVEKDYLERLLEMR